MLWSARHRCALRLCAATLCHLVAGTVRVVMSRGEKGLGEKKRGRREESKSFDVTHKPGSRWTERLTHCGWLGMHVCAAQPKR